MRLSERMVAVAAMVTPGCRLADVGCDHGYLSLWLCLQGIAKKSIALDVNRGPLQSAEKHIEAMGLGAYIETRLSDGLEAVSPGEVDSVVIAGMGGRLICRILSRGETVIRNIRELIVEPQSEAAEVRGFLEREFFQIERENMVQESGKFYPVIRAIPSREKSRLTGEELRFGPQLLKNRHPLLRQYLEREEENYRGIEAGLRGQNSGRAAARQTEIQEELRYIRRAKTYYEK